MDKRANAVARCGQEIMELRALNRHQEQELQAQRQASAERERAMERLADDAANVANIDLPELQGDPLEIARAKVHTAATRVGGSVLVADASLCINALNGLPARSCTPVLRTLAPRSPAV